MNYARKWLAAILLMLAAGDAAFAQEHMTIQAAAGAAVSFIQTENAGAKFTPRVLPHIGISALIPIEGRFSLKTGVAYEQKGWGVYSEYTDTSDNIRSEFTSAIKLHAISIPLELCYTVSQGRLFRYMIAGGMRYSFFARAEEKMVLNAYYKERFLQTETLFWNPPIGVIPDDSRLKSTYDGAAYYLFNPALRADATIAWQKSRYSLQVFGEYYLNQISATVGSVSMHLVYCGLSLGINLR